MLQTKKNNPEYFLSENKNRSRNPKYVWYFLPNNGRKYLKKKVYLPKHLEIWVQLFYYRLLKHSHATNNNFLKKNPVDLSRPHVQVFLLNSRFNGGINFDNYQTPSVILCVLIVVVFMFSRKSCSKCSLLLCAHAICIWKLLKWMIYMDLHNIPLLTLNAIVSTR